ncbi:MAG: 2-C-methyl-D-erythritol 2,4-cyclodiphosphate synthase [Pyrinomonadaceae bacterium]
MFRIGIGTDIHRLAADRPLILGGIPIPSAVGAVGHSDADALSHAITDALLGALAEGDIGTHFPDTDPKWKDVDSTGLLSRVMGLVREHGYDLVNLDSVVMLERPQLRPFIDAIRQRLAEVLKVPCSSISVKAKTAEKFDAVGEGRAIQVQAIVLVSNDTNFARDR